MASASTGSSEEDEEELEVSLEEDSACSACCIALCRQWQGSPNRSVISSSVGAWALTSDQSMSCDPARVATK